MYTYRVYYLSEETVTAASFVQADSVGAAIRLGEHIFTDKLFAPQIDKMEVWLERRLLRTVPLRAATLLAYE